MPAQVTLSESQFAQLLDTVRNARAASVPAAAPASAAAQPVTETELRSMDTQQLGRGLVGRLSESHGLASPWWGAENTAPAADLSANDEATLIRAAQHFTADQRAGVLDAALRANYRLNSPAWRR
jgi:hypothetical protein